MNVLFAASSALNQSDLNILPDVNVSVERQDWIAILKTEWCSAPKLGSQGHRRCRDGHRQEPLRSLPDRRRVRLHDGARRSSHKVSRVCSSRRSRSSQVKPEGRRRNHERQSILSWYHIVRVHYRWPLLEAIRYALSSNVVCDLSCDLLDLGWR